MLLVFRRRRGHERIPDSDAVSPLVHGAIFWDQNLRGVEAVLWEHGQILRDSLGDDVKKCLDGDWIRSAALSVIIIIVT